MVAAVAVQLVGTAAGQQRDGRRIGDESRGREKGLARLGDVHEIDERVSHELTGMPSRS
jgi:hypothetical protein